MPAPLPRLTFGLAVPLALVLAACGEPNPVIAECTDAQTHELVLCSADDGSACTPERNTIVEWTGLFTEPPVLTWTYPCHPDGYRVILQRDPGWGQGAVTFLASAEITAYDPEVGGPGRSWSPDAHLSAPGSRYRYLLRPMQSGEADSEAPDYSEIVFWTGPFCVGTPPPNPPFLSFPQDGVTLVIPQQSISYFPIFGWSYGYHPPCLMKFQGQVATDEAFTTDLVPILGRGNSPMDMMGVVKRYLEWCHEYSWRVRAVTDDGQGPWSETRTFSLMPEGGEEQCSEADIPVRTPHVGVEAIVTKNAACRIGPGTNYGISAYAAAGEKRPVDGRNADGTWFRFSDLKCYVAGSLLEGIPDVPVLPDPPLPTETTAKGPSGPVCNPTAGTEDACTAGGGTWTCVLKCQCVCP